MSSERFSLTVVLAVFSILRPLSKITDDDSTMLLAYV